MIEASGITCTIEEGFICVYVHEHEKNPRLLFVMNASNGMRLSMEIMAASMTLLERKFESLPPGKTYSPKESAN